MKKIISVLLCVAILVGCVCAASGCAKQETAKNDIVLITNGGTIKDGGFNQSAWEGITSYADENALNCNYYQPVLEDGKLTVDMVEKYVELSAENGAEYIVFPGADFAVSAYELASSYPDVKFILIGARPHSADDNTDRFISNVMSVSFDAVQSGFLAGFVSVMNGNKELGVFGEFSQGNSSQYGAGFVQGAAYAADSLGIPVTVDWADYDSPLLNFNYDFTITATYKKVADQKFNTFNVNVENGIGTGTYKEGSNVTITADPAPVGQVFDHWETKSDTEGVKDKKVNISSKTKSSMNLLVEECDCTISAVYKDLEGTSYTVTVMDAAGKTPVSVQSVAEGDSCWVEAPVADKNLVFKQWSTTSDKVEDLLSKGTMVKDIDSDIVLTPVYEVSSIPTFNITVETGEGGNGDSTGSGSYVSGDRVTVAAAVPAEGYMFDRWVNVDAYGNSTGISMDNEYYWNTSFDMVDRYASICSAMFNHGVTTVFAGGNSRAASAFTSKGAYDYNLNVITTGENNKNSYLTVVDNYGEAVKDCLENYQGGTVVLASCATDALYSTFVATDNEDIQAAYDEVYKKLANGEIKLIQVQEGAGYDFCKYFNENKRSKCLTLNDMFIENAVSFN